MFPNAPKEHFSVPSSPFLPFFRNALLAIMLTVGHGSIVLSSPKVPDIPSAPAKTPKQKKPAPAQKCRPIGDLKVIKDTIVLEAVCIKGKILSMADVILLANKSVHYQIPNTDVYFYINENGEPIISFMKDGERITGMLTKIGEKEYSFEQYLPFIYPDKSENK